MPPPLAMRFWLSQRKRGSGKNDATPAPRGRSSGHAMSMESLEHIEHMVKGRVKTFLRHTLLAHHPRHACARRRHLADGLHDHQGDRPQDRGRAGQRHRRAVRPGARQEIRAGPRQDAARSSCPPTARRKARRRSPSARRISPSCAATSAPRPIGRSSPSCGRTRWRSSCRRQVRALPRRASTKRKRSRRSASSPASASAS